MPFERNTGPTTPSCFVGTKGTPTDDYVIHAGPGPAGSYPDRADALAAAEALTGPPSNVVDAQVFVADPDGHFTNLVAD